MVTKRIGFGRDFRAVFAADPATSHGRLYAENPSPTRTEFQRDRDRIIHSTGFRRLQGKTQVFLPDEGDHYRTRLTHTIEVAQITRALARALRLDEDLAEALALAHDLGHPPFGHAGERALNRAMSAHGGFDHNAQSLRVVTLLERRYPRFRGLNLTWETLEGLVKHNGPLVDRSGKTLTGTELPFAIVDYTRQNDLWLWSYPSLEAQAASIADDIAYDAHDIDDGLRASLLNLDDLAGLDLIGRILAAVDEDFPRLDPERRADELIRRLITTMIEDVIAESLTRIDALSPQSADDVRNASAPAIAFSTPMATADREIKEHLTAHVYRHRRVMNVMDRAEAVVDRLFERYWQDPSTLSADWRLPDNAGDDDRARQISDFLAGMTDRYALAEHKRLFGESAELGYADLARRGI
jgi:dGTPase